MAKVRVAKASVEDLKKEIVRRQRKLPELIAARDALNRQIAELEGLSGAKPRAVGRRKPGRRKAARRAVKPARAGSLSSAFVDALGAKGKLTVAEAADAVQAAGYKSKSKDFPEHRQHGALEGQAIQARSAEVYIACGGDACLSCGGRPYGNSGSGSRREADDRENSARSVLRNRTRVAHVVRLVMCGRRACERETSGGSRLKTPRHIEADGKEVEKVTFIYGEMEVLASWPMMYYCGCGWRGGQAPTSGYSGIQQHPGLPNNAIFSVWDTSPKLLAVCRPSRLFDRVLPRSPRMKKKGAVAIPTLHAPGKWARCSVSL